MGHGADRGRLAEVGGASRLICNLFCPIGAVARIAKTRDNKRLFVQPLIDGGGPDAHIRVDAAQALVSDISACETDLTA